MKRTHQWLLIGCGVVLAGALTGEHLSRRSAEQRYQSAIASKRQLEQRVTHVLTTHEQLQHELAQEQERSHELANAFLSMRSKLEEAVGRLMLEAQTTRELHTRLASMQHQMDQLQGELVLALQGHESAPSQQGSQGAVQLERIIVSRSDAPGLQGRVLSVDKNWNFVVVDLGWNTVSIGETLSIYRNEQLLAKARVERVQEGMCAATLLPEGSTTEIQVNDQVRAL